MPALSLELLNAEALAAERFATKRRCAHIWK
jgi:hypothetical protein